MKLDPAQAPNVQNGHLDSDEEVSPPPPPIPPRSQSFSPQHTSKKKSLVHPNDSSDHVSLFPQGGKPSAPSSPEQELAPPILPPKPTHSMSPKASKRETHSEERHIPGAESLTPATRLVVVLSELRAFKSRLPTFVV